MKSYIKLVAVLVIGISLVMCGCEKETQIKDENIINTDSMGTSNAEVEAEQEIVPEVSDETIIKNVDEQLTIMAENKAIWTTDLEYADEVYCYAVTDLDHNGRYEIIVSNMGGTGLYTYSRFFEINEILDGIVECDNDFMEGDSQPDIMVEQVDTYVDENGEFHYILPDALRNGMAEYYENIRELMLRDGQIITKYLATKSTVYDGEVPNVTCMDYEGNVITEEEYESVADNYFTGYEKVITNINWQDVRQLPDHVEGIKNMLEESL